jgi:hypothetical protein
MGWMSGRSSLLRNELRGRDPPGLFVPSVFSQKWAWARRHFLQAACETIRIEGAEIMRGPAMNRESHAFWLLGTLLRAWHDGGHVTTLQYLFSEVREFIGIPIDHQDVAVAPEGFDAPVKGVINQGGYITVTPKNREAAEAIYEQLKKMMLSQGEQKS